MKSHHPSIDQLVSAKHSYHSASSDMGRAEARLSASQENIIGNIDTCLLHMLVNVRNGEGNGMEPVIVRVSKYVQALRRSMGP